MHIEQLYTGCLSQGAYYITSGNEAVVIDPLRDVDTYIQKAEQDGVNIKYVLETHFHADFVSGHVELARRTGATIIYGPTARPAFEATVVNDETVLHMGDITITVLHTPGHTMESCCYLLKDEQGVSKALFTGDTLFLGDVGRPDLAQKAARLTTNELAGLMYDSIRNKIMPLPDDIIIYPSHGAGSACGKNISADRFDTLGHQKETNYALRQEMSKAEFIKEVTTGLPKPPQYFPFNVMMNKMGAESIDGIMHKGLRKLSPAEFEAAVIQHEALVLDTRSGVVFLNGFVPGSINIGLNGSFAPWAGALIPDIKQPILLITEPGQEEESIKRLARVGYDNCIGYLDGGLKAWTDAGNEVNNIECITANELADRIEEKPLAIILDVRTTQEYANGHIAGALNMPLSEINTRMTELDNDTLYYIHCAAGYRSVIFISILMARGFEKLVNVTSGFDAITQSGRFNVAVEVTVLI